MCQGGDYSTTVHMGEPLDEQGSIQKDGASLQL